MDRLRRGAFTEKYGFSVVAPTRTRVPSSTDGSRASCWARLKRWTSSRKKMVPRSCSARSRRAPATVSRTSLTPAVTADIGTKAFRVAPAMRRARVVLPGARRAPEDHRGQPVGLDQGPQRPARGQQVVLADDLVQGTRAHPGGQRGLGGQSLVERRREQVVVRAGGHGSEATGVGSRRGGAAGAGRAAGVGGPARWVTGTWAASAQAASPRPAGSVGRR